MHLLYKTYSLALRHTFSISGNSRKETPIILIEVKIGDHTGYGEASLPPYLQETQASVLRFLGKVDLKKFDESFTIEEIMLYVNERDAENYAAKASIDIALHDLRGKIESRPLWQIIGTDPALMPDTSCTLGMDTPEIIKEKISETLAYKLLKVKLGGTMDRETIETIRKHTFKPLCADANQGWHDKHQALDMIWFLKDQGCRFIEQPLPKENIKDMIWLSENSPLPLVADESCQGLQDIDALHGVFRGINIKLMKCGGILEAIKMIEQAKKLDLKILMGCMNESSCAILAASALAPLCNWADLDGPFLINNNPFIDPQIKTGKIVLSSKPGLGLELKPETFF